MPIANFCNGSMKTLSSTANFLPGQDVIITCSFPQAVAWNSAQFTDGAILISDDPDVGVTSGTRLNGTIVFNLTNTTSGPPVCVTATATIANIQESMQGFTLNCNNILSLTAVTIGIIGIGKLHVIHVWKVLKL